MPRPDDWRRFGSARYRPFHLISTGQAWVTAFAADALVVPFMLALGAPTWLVTIAGALPIAGSVASAANPAILRRIGGNLRRLTLTLATFETRGLAYALVAACVASGILASGTAIALVVAILGIGQTAALLSTSNISLWTAMVLPDEERRVVGPRSTVLVTVLATALLLPVSAVLDAALDVLGIWAYAALFLGGGIGGALVPLGTRRLPRPGRLLPGGAGGRRAPLSAGFVRFSDACGIGAIGQGLIPYAAIYSLTVLHLSPGFAVMLSATGWMASLAASVAVGSFLAHGSASRVLRASFAIRAVAAGLALAAIRPRSLAPTLMLLATLVFWAGGSAGSLAQNERMFRLLNPTSAVAGQARFIATNAAASTAGALAQAGLLALAGPAADPVFGTMYAGAGVLRLVAALRTEVTPSWRVGASERPDAGEAELEAGRSTRRAARPGRGAEPVSA